MLVQPCTISLLPKRFDLTIKFEHDTTSDEQTENMMEKPLIYPAMTTAQGRSN